MELSNIANLDVTTTASRLEADDSSAQSPVEIAPIKFLLKGSADSRPRPTIMSKPTGFA